MVAITFFILLIVSLISIHSYSHQNLKFKLSRKNSNYKFPTISIKAANDDSVFGSEFVSNKNKKKSFPKPGSNGRGNTVMTDQEWEELQLIKKQSKQSFDGVRKTFLLDSLFFSFLGLTAVWYFGTFKDAYSYLTGAGLGLIYAGLLTRFVETLGSGEGSRGGSLRYLPVVILILLYGKFRATFSIIPEIIGFFSYQVGSLFQAFNEDLYKEDSD